MANETVTTLNAALMTQWPQERLTESLYKDAVALALVPKNTKLSGEDLIVAVRYAGTQGRSTSFTKAQTNATGTKQARFRVTFTEDYGTATIDGKAIRFAKLGPGALVDGLDSMMESVVKSLKRSLSMAVYGNGGGAIGRRGSVALTVLTLATREDIVNFEVGQVICAADGDGSATAHALRNAGSTVTVVAVDPIAGTVTANANWSTITGFIDGDYVFIDGDFKSKLKGFGAWVPVSAPVFGVDSFYGVDRGVHPVRLAGWRYTAPAGLGVEEAIIRGLAEGALFGSFPKDLFINPINARDLELGISGKVVYDRSKSFDRPDIGFDCIVVNTAHGKVKVHADPSCPKDKIYALTLDTWKLHTAGPCPGPLNDDGLMIARKQSEDAYEARQGLYGCMYNTDPLQNGVIQLS